MTGHGTGGTRQSVPQIVYGRVLLFRHFILAAHLASHIDCYTSHATHRMSHFTIVFLLSFRNILGVASAFLFAFHVIFRTESLTVYLIASWTDNYSSTPLIFFITFHLRSGWFC
jgi:hypothetical protein